MDKLITNLDTNLGPVLREQLDTNFQKIQNGVDGQLDSLNKQIEAMLGDVPLQDKNEVTQARIDDNNVVYSTLKGRLDTDQSTAETALKEERMTGIEVKAARSNTSGKNYDSLKARIDDAEVSLTNNMNAKIARISSVPEAFANLSTLQSTYPNGKTGIFVTVDNGHKYIWFNGQWNDCGVYQSSSIWDKNVTIVHAEDLKPPYNDANEYPANSTVTIDVDPSLIQNIPQKTSFTMITMSANSDLTGAVQFFIPQSGSSAYYRIAWQLPHIYTRWISLYSDGNNTQIFTSKLNDSNKDLSKLPANSTITYAIDDNSKLIGVPDTVDGPFTITTKTSSNEGLGGAYQLLITQNLSIFMRLAWGDPPVFSEWISIGRNSFNKQIFNSNLTDAYQNLNKLKVNTTVTYDCDPSKLANMPAGENSSFTIRTINAIDDNASGAVQLLFSQSGHAYWRLGWGVPAFYDEWKKFYPVDVPQPVTNSIINPSISLFQNIGIIGDSYASGELYVNGNYIDHYDISWGQILARKNGIKAVNFSKGGLTTRDWLTDDHGLSLLNSSDPQDLYIIVLGINDYQKLGDSYLGAENDVNTEADTFYSNYGKIISAIRAKAPQAKIVLSTMSYDTQGTAHNYNEAINTLAQHFGLPVIEQNNDALFTSDFYLTHMIGGHPTAPVYAAMANAFQRLIEKSMIDNLDYFMTYKQ